MSIIGMDLKFKPEGCQHLPGWLRAKIVMNFALRGMDLNHRPSGYEPDELTRLLYRAQQPCITGRRASRIASPGPQHRQRHII